MENAPEQGAGETGTVIYGCLAQSSMPTLQAVSTLASFEYARDDGIEDAMSLIYSIFLLLHRSVQHASCVFLDNGPGSSHMSISKKKKTYRQIWCALSIARFSFLLTRPQTPVQRFRRRHFFSAGNSVSK